MTWIDRQLPEGDEVFLDHVGLFVRDLEAARAAFARLGFAVSDVNVHMNADAEGRLVPSGTANALVTPALGYVEVLAKYVDSPLSAQLDAALARYEGLHLLAFSHTDVPGQAPRLAHEGFQPLEPVNLRRELETANGIERVGFSVLRVPPDAMPEGRVQWCGHLTPHLVWWPHLTRHANAAEALTGALFVVADLDEALDRYARFTAKPVTRTGDIGHVALERGDLVFATVDGARRLLPGLDPPDLPYGAVISLGSADLDAAHATWHRGGVRPEAGASDLALVGAGDACGARLLVHGPAVTDPWERLAAIQK